MKATPSTTITPTDSTAITALHRDDAAAVLAAAVDVAGRAGDDTTAVVEVVRAAVAAAGAGATGAVDLVRVAQARLLTSLARNPFFDPSGVRASRLLFAAADELQHAAAAPLAPAA